MTEQPALAGVHQPAGQRDDPDAVAAHVGPAFGELAKIALGAQSLGAVMHRIAELAGQIVPGADEVSLTLIEQRQPRTVWFAGSLAAVLDEQQYPPGRGPCLDAAATGRTITIDDTAADQLYPEFSRQAYNHGIRCVLAVGMPGAPEGTAALGIYSNGDDGPFTLEARDVAVRFANYAAVALANAAVYARTLDEVAQMKSALASRAVIEQAKGVIMHDYRCDAAEAFDILVELSTDADRTLGEVAAALTAAAARAGPPDGSSSAASEPSMQSTAMNLVDGFDDRDMAALARLTPAARAEQRRARTALFNYTEQLWVQARAEGIRPGARSGYDAVSALRNLMDALCGHVDEAQQAAGDGGDDY